MVCVLLLLLLLLTGYPGLGLLCLDTELGARAVPEWRDVGRFSGHSAGSDGRIVSVWHRKGVDNSVLHPLPGFVPPMSACLSFFLSLFLDRLFLCLQNKKRGDRMRLCCNICMYVCVRVCGLVRLFVLRGMYVWMDGGQDFLREEIQTGIKRQIEGERGESKSESKSE